MATHLLSARDRTEAKSPEISPLEWAGEVGLARAGGGAETSCSHVKQTNPIYYFHPPDIKATLALATLDTPWVGGRM